MSNKPPKPGAWSLCVKGNYSKKVYAVKKKFGFTIQSVYISDLWSSPAHSDRNFVTLEKAHKFVKELNS